MRENADLTIETNRRVVLTKLRFRRHCLPMYAQPIAALRLKVRMFKAEVTETMLLGRVTRSPTVAHFAVLRAAHHRWLLHCIGWKRAPCDGYHTLSYADALAKTGSQ